MEISAELAADLGLLTEALNDRDADVASSLAAIEATVLRAVPSYLGLTGQVVNGDRPFTFTTLQHPVDLPPMSASLSILFPDRSDDRDAGGDPSFVLTFYARTSGAFVDLAADIGWIAGHRPSMLVLDRWPPRPVPGDTLTLMQQSAVDQAVGILIGTGRTQEQAYRELTIRARAGRVERHVVARTILGEVAGGHRPAV